MACVLFGSKSSLKTYCQPNLYRLFDKLLWNLDRNAFEENTLWNCRPQNDGQVYTEFGKVPTKDNTGCESIKRPNSKYDWCFAWWNSSETGTLHWEAPDIFSAVYTGNLTDELWNSYDIFECIVTHFIEIIFFNTWNAWLYNACFFLCQVCQY